MPLENVSFVVEDKECMPEMHFLVGGLPHLHVNHVSKRIRSSTALGTGGKAWEQGYISAAHLTMNLVATTELTLSLRVTSELALFVLQTCRHPCCWLPLSQSASLS